MTLSVEILSIFPEAFTSFLTTSLIHKACERGQVSFNISNIRDFASPPHFKVDDTPYGGGAGMVMMPEPIVKAVAAAKAKVPHARVVALSAGGKPFNQHKAYELAKEEALIFICGRYEGIDQRAVDLVVDEEISIGDYILMGGELAAMVVVEALARLIPGVLGNLDSHVNESFSEQNDEILEAPQYTKPQIFEGREVPAVLLSGDHKKISAWRKEEGLRRTEIIRPELLKKRS
jgi:tRNA (guanine37-N1)-methyltransferase